MVTQEFMFELYVRDSANETADVEPYDKCWGFMSDGEAHLFAIQYMDQLAEQGYDLDLIYCVFQKDHNDWIDNKFEFATYDCLDYLDIDSWILAIRQNDPGLLNRNGATNG